MPQTAKTRNPGKDLISHNTNPKGSSRRISDKSSLCPAGRDWASGGAMQAAKTLRKVSSRTTVFPPQDFKSTMTPAHLWVLKVTSGAVSRSRRVPKPCHFSENWLRDLKDWKASQPRKLHPKPYLCKSKRPFGREMLPNRRILAPAAATNT